MTLSFFYVKIFKFIKHKINAYLSCCGSVFYSVFFLKVNQNKEVEEVIWFLKYYNASSLAIHPKIRLLFLPWGNDVLWLALE